MRRGVGLAGLRHQKELENQKKDVGGEMQKDRQEHIATLLSEFKENLSDFSSKYRSQISKDPVFRHAFTEMTSKLGVDPLASSKGLWWQLGLGDFYSELGVQIVDVCIRTRVRNGGIISLSNLLMELDKMRTRGSMSESVSAGGGGGGRASASLPRATAAVAAAAPVAITVDDILRSLDKLGKLGGGYRVVNIAGQQYIITVPYELKEDPMLVIQFSMGEGAKGAGAATASSNSSSSSNNASAAAKEGGGKESDQDVWVTNGKLIRSLGWEGKRSEVALDSLLREGMAWIDTGNPEKAADGPRYYFPGFR